MELRRFLPDRQSRSEIADEREGKDQDGVMNRGNEEQIDEQEATRKSDSEESSEEVSAIVYEKESKMRWRRHLALRGRVLCWPEAPSERILRIFREGSIGTLRGMLLKEGWKRVKCMGMEERSVAWEKTLLAGNGIKGGSRRLFAFSLPFKHRLR